MKLDNSTDVWVKKSDGGYQITAEKHGKDSSLSSRALLLNYALGVAEEWIRKQAVNSNLANKDAAWRSLPATEKQITALNKMGLVLNYGNCTRGKASQLLDSKLHEPATKKQLYWLRKHGLCPKKGLSRVEACRMIAQKK